MKIGRERVQGAIAVSKQGFLLSSQAAGFEEGLSPVLSRALEGRYSLGDIQAGDRFRIIAQEVTVLGQFSRYSGIEAIEYLPVGEKALRLYYFRGTVSKGYFDARGRAPGQGGWRKPIPDAPRTSKFNPRRLHPIKKIIMPHNGTDFGAPTGTPIGASSSGVISFIGNAGPSGNLVKIQHSAGIETGYAHLSRFASGLKVGDRVARMQVVGYCGSTGRSTGPHLHFSAKRDGKYIDPESLKLDALTMLGPKERAMLSEVRSRYDRLLDVIQLPEAVAVAPPPAASAPIVVDDAPHFERGASPTASPDLPSVNVAPPAAPKLAPTATATAARPTSASAAATRRDYSTLYLTDRELLRSQSQQDDGESDE
ncbi:MAG: M23 family metallopeptidase [Polyangiaceae bacterium]|nr:M23 family metallopeptidase [Polyangiaceae bacterium]